MIRITTCLLLLVLAACAREQGDVAPLNPLVGTWKLQEWRTQDSLGVWLEGYGSAPKGYFVYGPTGFLSIHLMHEDGAAVTDCADDPEAFLTAPLCYVGYFGTYRIEDDSTVTHLPEGGTILSYIGTEQPRRYEVHGDSLWIQRSETVYRLLLRVR